MDDLKKLVAAGVPELKTKLGAASWEFVRVNPGRFRMGSPPTETGREDGEVPLMNAEISRPFYLGRYQTTQLQWRSIIGSNPSEVRGDDLAVNQIRYSAALEFCRKLSVAFGVTVTLPTEAQWEYACRAGTQTRFYSGTSDSDLDRVAWYRDNSGSKVHAVGQKQPNPWGLYDMLGNLYEPCIDYITSFTKLQERDPVGGRSTTKGAMRGGFYMDPPERCRAASRLRTTDRFGGMGVRLAIVP